MGCGQVSELSRMDSGNGGEWVDEEILIDWNNERARGLVGSIGE